MNRIGRIRPGTERIGRDAQDRRASPRPEGECVALACAEPMSTAKISENTCPSPSLRLFFTQVQGVRGPLVIRPALNLVGRRLTACRPTVGVLGCAVAVVLLMGCGHKSVAPRPAVPALDEKAEAARRQRDFDDLVAEMNRGPEPARTRDELAKFVAEYANIVVGTVQLVEFRPDPDTLFDWTPWYVAVRIDEVLQGSAKKGQYLRHWIHSPFIDLGPYQERSDLIGRRTAWAFDLDGEKVTSIEAPFFRQFFTDEDLHRLREAVHERRTSTQPVGAASRPVEPSGNSHGP